MRTACLTLLLLAGLAPCAGTTALARGQADPLARAKELYAKAAYREALTALDALGQAGSEGQGAEAIETEKLRAFCLLAVGDTAAADEAFGRIVTAEPLYRLEEGSVSGRVALAFRDARRRRLPALVRQAYERGKQAYDARQAGAAREQFQLAIDLAADPDMEEKAPLVDDLQNLAADFMRLLEAEAAALEARTLASVLTRAPEVRTVFGADDAEVVAPVAISQHVPAWPAWLRAAGVSRRTAVLEIIVDEKGRVESAIVRPPLDPVYDGMLIEACRRWRFEPATRGSSRVKYRKLIEIVIPGLEGGQGAAGHFST